MFYAPCSTVVTHTSSHSQRAYIRNAKYELKFCDEVVLSYTSLTDVEVVSAKRNQANRALLVVEVRLSKN